MKGILGRKIGMTEKFTKDGKNIPVTVVATKCDKVSRNSYIKNERLIKETLNLDENDQLIQFSSVSKIGKQEIHNKIIEIIGV